MHCFQAQKTAGGKQLYYLHNYSLALSIDGSIAILWVRQLSVEGSKIFNQGN
jgi:hypothetical protein